MSRPALRRLSTHSYFVAKKNWGAEREGRMLAPQLGRLCPNRSIEAPKGSAKEVAELLFSIAAKRHHRHGLGEAQCLCEVVPVARLGPVETRHLDTVTKRSGAILSRISSVPPPRPESGA
jgi:hypothetical protein